MQGVHVMKRPVFVVGCPRSGTTLLYSMLVAAGGFAFYRKETYLFAVAHRFPHLDTDGVRARFVNQFLAGYLGRVPGLDIEPIVRQAIRGCETPSDFLARLMEAVALAQRVERWVEATPAHVLYLREIKRAVPDALVVHVIRDGRDCALSLERQRWLPTCPWDRGAAVAAVYWEWMVRAGQASGRLFPQDYLEVRFEDLIDAPAETLKRVGLFIDHDLSYDRVVKNPVHSMYVPNTSFGRNANDFFDPVGRWRSPLAAADARSCEGVVGPLLKALGYDVATPTQHRVRSTMTRAAYINYFRLKHAAKAHTPLGRLMTSARIWAEQPRPGERPVRRIPNASDSELSGPEGKVAIRNCARAARQGGERGGYM